MGKPRDQIKSSCFFLLSSRLLPSVPLLPTRPSSPSSPPSPSPVDPPHPQKTKNQRIGPQEKKKKEVTFPLVKNKA